MPVMERLAATILPVDRCHARLRLSSTVMVFGRRNTERDNLIISHFPAATARASQVTEIYRSIFMNANAFCGA